MSCQFCESSAPDHSWCDCLESIQYAKELSANKAEYYKLTTSAEAFTMPALNGVIGM